MSFPLKQLTFFNSTYKLSKSQRKEQDSSLAHHDRSNNSPYAERASAFTSKGSITLEAAFSLSLFFFAAISLVYLLEIMAIQTSVKNALHMVAKEYAEEAYLYPFISIESVERKIVERIGEERLERSIVVGGSSGLDLSKTKKRWNTTIVDFIAEYRLEIPISIFNVHSPLQSQTVRVKGWTGYETAVPDMSSEEMVYMTDYGVVYHTDASCTYLDLSVRAIEKITIEKIRNRSGRKYKACSLCKNLSAGDVFYITDYGERYHGSLECSGLRRMVYAVPLTDVYGVGGCSKCAKRQME